MNQLKVNNLTFNGKEYTPRSNSINNFYAKALKLQREFAVYESMFVDSDNHKTLLSLKADDPDYMYYAEKVLTDKYLCYEIFLTSNLNAEPSTANAELLNEIMLTEQIEHTKERTGEEYSEYIEFMVGLLIDFFQKYSPLRHLGNQLTNSSKATQSGMKSTQAE